MAALFDLHCLIALQNGWLRINGASTTSDNGKKNFRACFPFIEDAVVDSWWADLDDVKFRSYASPGTDSFPMVVVKLENETPNAEFLGDALYPYMESGVDKGRTVLGNVVSQDIDVYVATTSHELTRALYTVIRALMHQLVPTFLGAGYIDIRFQSATELLPDEQLISEDAGVFVRHMRWRALAQIESFPLAQVEDSGTPWYINVADITGGKVTPSSS